MNILVQRNHNSGNLETGIPDAGNRLNSAWVICAWIVFVCQALAANWSNEIDYYGAAEPPVRQGSYGPFFQWYNGHYISVFYDIIVYNVNAFFCWILIEVGGWLFTSSLKMKPRNVIEQILPATGHKYCTAHLFWEGRECLLLRHSTN